MIVGLIALISCKNDALTTHAVVEKAILAHDPHNHWPQLSSRFDMSIRREGQPDRYFSVLLDNTEQHFEYALNQGDSIIAQGVVAGTYYYQINGSAQLADSVKERYQLNEARTQYLTEVYEYLIGIPMKLKDPGTVIDPGLAEVTFNGENCWVIRVSYDPSTEGETWYFYINRATYMLEGYRFYFDESTGDGEFIEVDGYEEVNGLKIAKIKKWYWNRDSAHFRTDEVLRIR